MIARPQRPEGATIDEVAAAMVWRRHTVRGLISRGLKKKLGLEVVLQKSESGPAVPDPGGGGLRDGG